MVGECCRTHITYMQSGVAVASSVVRGGCGKRQQQRVISKHNFARHKSAGLAVGRQVGRLAAN